MQDICPYSYLEKGMKGDGENLHGNKSPNQQGDSVGVQEMVEKEEFDKWMVVNL